MLTKSTPASKSWYAARCGRIPIRKFAPRGYTPRVLSMLFVFLSFLGGQKSFAQSPTIRTDSLNKTTFCVGETMIVWFSTTGTFPGGNVFTAERSNPGGPFEGNTTVLTTTGGPYLDSVVDGRTYYHMNITIPALNPGNGNHYAIRVNSSAPNLWDPSTGKPASGYPEIAGTPIEKVRNADVYIYPAITPYNLTSSGSICGIIPATVQVSNTQAGVNYQLFLVGADNSLTPVGSPIVGASNCPANQGCSITFTNITTAGTYIVKGVTGQGGCEATMNGQAVFAAPNTITRADAGPDQKGAATCGLTQVTLAGNTPGSTESGSWSIVSGTGGFFGDTNNPTATSTNPAATFYGVAGNSYILRWTISDGCGNSADEVEVTFHVGTAQPGVISGLAAVCPGTAQTYSVPAVEGVTYSWTVPSGWSITSSPANTNSIQVTTGATGDNGTVSVSAVNICGAGEARTLAVTVGDAAPAAPAFDGASAGGCTSISLVWSASARAIGYKLYQATANDGPYTLVDTYTGTSAALSGLPAHTTYYFKVEAYNDCGSNTSAASSYATLPAAPAAPTAHAGSDAACGSITANWDASANAASYRLDVSTADDFSSFVTGYQDLNVGNVTTRVISGLTAGTAYYYRVRAVNTCGTSPSSGVITYSTLPAAPATPGAITGNASQCPGLTNQSYSISEVSNATTYYWSVPAGWNITDGQGSASIKVTVGSAGENGNISVTASNTCGRSDAQTLAVTVNSRPTGAISGTTTICTSGSATLSLAVTGSGTISGTLSDGTTFSGTAPTITVSVNPASTTTYTIATLSDSKCASVSAGRTGSAVVTVVNQPAGPTLNMKTPAEVAVCEGMPVKATFTAGTGGVGCTDSYRYSTTNGASWAAYTPNTDISTTNATTVLIQGRRADCTTAAGCNGTAWTTLASWTVNPTFCAVYDGDLFKNTNDPAGGTATVNLVVVVTKDPASSPIKLDPGTFTISVDGKPVEGTPDVSYTLDASNPTSITYSIPFTVTLPYNGYLSRQLNVSWSFTNSCYVANKPACSEGNTIVTVSAPADNFVTGGGYIIPLNSGGRVGGAEVNGLKNNFGFNLKFNKGGKLQGNWNTIIRRRENGKVVVYQVKSNSASTLVVTKTSTSSYRADMTFTSANFKNLTCDLCPVDANNGTVQLTIIDNGEPGAWNDRILITIKDKNGAVWYTSDAAANHSKTFTGVLQALNAGNIQVRSGGTSPVNTTPVTSIGQKAVAEREIIEPPARKFDIKAFPNPTTSGFQLQLESANRKDRISVRVVDLFGRTVQVLHNLQAGQTLKLGAEYRPGMYVVEMIQGAEHRKIKVLKQPD